MRNYACAYTHEMVRHSVACVLILVLPACLPKSEVSLTGRGSTSGFSMAVQASQYNVVAGNTTYVDVSVSRVKGDNEAIGSIIFALANAPAGLSLGGEMPATASTASLPLIASPSITPGNYSVALKGTGGNVEQTLALTVTVLAPGAFSVSLGSSMVSVVGGSSAQVVVTIDRTGALNGDVSLSALGVPADLSAAFAPASTAGTSSVLTLSAMAGASAGTYTLTISGTHPDAATSSATLSVSVIGPGSFSLSLPSSSIDVYTGGSAQTNVIISRASGFAGNVQLAASGLVAGLGVSFTPTQTTAGNAVATISAGPSTAVGQHSILIEGSNPDAGTDSAPLLLNVMNPPPTCSDTCVAAAPSGFIGPLAVSGGAGFPSCTADFPTQTADAYRNITNPAAICSCNCDAPPSYECQLDLYGARYASGTCTGPNDGYGYWLSAGMGCLGYGSPYNWKPVGVFAYGAACTATGSKTKPPEAKTSVRACGGSFARIDCAANQVCVPVPTDRSLCVYSVGDVACPAATYTAKTLHYSSVADSRDCSPACSCGTTRDCSGSPTTYKYGASCASTANFGDCRNSTFIQYNGTSGTASCALTPGAYAPTGAVAGTGVVTLCCQP